MGEIRNCPACHGSKTIMGGGMIFKSCPTCDGHGKVIYDTNNPVLDSDEDLGIDSIKSLKKNKKSANT